MKSNMNLPPIADLIEKRFIFDRTYYIKLCYRLSFFWEMNEARERASLELIWRHSMSAWIQNFPWPVSVLWLSFGLISETLSCLPCSFKTKFSRFPFICKNCKPTFSPSVRDTFLIDSASYVLFRRCCSINFSYWTSSIIAKGRFCNKEAIYIL